MRRAGNFGSKPCSKAGLRAALAALLIMRANLDGIDKASLCRSYGIALPELDYLIGEEKLRRAKVA